MKRMLICTFAALALAACTSPTTPLVDLPADQPTLSTPNQIMPTIIPSSPAESPFAPHPSDGQLSRGKVFIDLAQIRTLESYPIQVQLDLKGNLPTPCHELRVEIKAPDAENKIQIEVYSLVDASKICVQVLKPFEANVALGSFPSGHYTVWINGEKIGEFDA
ncbi:MAG: hypothetical protein HY258_07215 [Chloroflexi bacterium]|nr:hypothetical protein [Chloroflexota bacterium]